MTTKIMQVVFPNKVPVILSLIMLTSCSIHYKNREGEDHYIGLVSMKIEKQGCLLVSTAKSVGLTVDATAESGGINLGARTTTKSYIGNNITVTIDEDADRNLIIKEYNSSLQKTQESCVFK